MAEKPTCNWDYTECDTCSIRLLAKSRQGLVYATRNNVISNIDDGDDFNMAFGGYGAGADGLPEDERIAIIECIARKSGVHPDHLI